MTENLDSEMMAAMQQSLVNEANKGADPVKVEEPAKVEPAKAEPIKTEEPAKVEPVKVEPAKVDPSKVEEPAKVEPVPQKSFEEELLARFDNKFKSVDEIKSLLETPQVEFADENIAHWNELAKKGIKIDKEFLELQAKDYEGMDDPIVIQMEAMRIKPEYKGLSDKTLEIQLNKQYNLAEWIEKEDADFTDDDTVIESYLEAAIAWAENYIGRGSLFESRVYNLDNFTGNNDFLVKADASVTALQYAAYNDVEEIEWLDLPVDNYLFSKLNNESCRLWFQGSLPLLPSGLTHSVIVTVAVVCPATVRSAILLRVGDMYIRREDRGEGNNTTIAESLMRAYKKWY